ncbi:MAG: hypothetical protein MR022_06760 [Ruminococcus sp.]|nr:hypothetical protein [Ruminococcus sp.]
MPNPKAIDVPKLGFSDAQTEVLNIMMNKEERDYSTVDEIAHMEEVRYYLPSSRRCKESQYDIRCFHQSWIYQ